MGKEKSKGNMSTAKAKKGSVINRRANRTVSEGYAKSDPKWKVGAHGVLTRVKGHSNPIRLVGPTGFASVSNKETEQPEDDKMWEKVGLPEAPPSTRGLSAEA